jgi:hypothetical protein
LRAAKQKIEFFRENENFFCLDEVDVEGKAFNKKFFG